jgi:ABC-2 type transport system ATP-binding protein
VRAGIKAEGLRKTYRGNGRGVVAVDGISFEVAAGEIFGLIGPNGAGKTTTVHMLATLLRPTAGTAWVAGHELVLEAQAIRREIGVALRQTRLDDVQTGRQLIGLIARLRGFGRRAARLRTAELLELVGLTDAADRRVGSYSGGMRRRIDLALALVDRPRLSWCSRWRCCGGSRSPVTRSRPGSRRRAPRRPRR